MNSFGHHLHNSLYKFNNFNFQVTKLIPTWLAPNVITITGFLNLLIAATFI